MSRAKYKVAMDLNMKKYLLYLSLILSLSGCESDKKKDNNSENEVDITDQILGTWKSPNTFVYIEVYDNGEVFQCRITQNLDIITANGLVSGSTIIWDELTAVDTTGASQDIGSISWGTEEAQLLNDELTLSGIYGAYTYQQTNDAIPQLCFIRNA
jgi:hypothetical protein